MSSTTWIFPRNSFSPSSFFTNADDDDDDDEDDDDTGAPARGSTVVVNAQGEKVVDVVIMSCSFCTLLLILCIIIWLYMKGVNLFAVIMSFSSLSWSIIYKKEHIYASENCHLRFCFNRHHHDCMPFDTSEVNHNHNQSIIHNWFVRNTQSW